MGEIVKIGFLERLSIHILQSSAILICLIAVLTLLYVIIRKLAFMYYKTFHRRVHSSNLLVLKTRNSHYRYLALLITIDRLYIILIVLIIFGVVVNGITSFR